MPTLKTSDERRQCRDVPEKSCGLVPIFFGRSFESGPELLLLCCVVFADVEVKVSREALVWLCLFVRACSIYGDVVLWMVCGNGELVVERV
jgi:hypothetical protein